jgi:hypothetical protein
MSVERTGRRSSFWRTTLEAAIGGGLIAGAAHVIALRQDASSSGLVLVAGWIVALACGGVALCGLVVLRRDSALATGKTDLFLAANKGRSESALADGAGAIGVFARLGRLLGICNSYVVGDLVKVRSFDEIAKTLDERDSLEGLPFMPEMRQYCGQNARVFRCADKIWDYNRSQKIRRLKDAVLLIGLRCSGSDHDGCQAGCYLIWKTDWLIRLADDEAPSGAGCQYGDTTIGRKVLSEDSSAGSSDGPLKSDNADARTYRCQFTELASATSPMASWDRRQDLRPLFSGNVTFLAFLLALATRIFNRVQRIRGRVEYAVVPPGNHKTTPLAAQDVQAGDNVRVRSEERILATLGPDRRNRGLWFDREMVKHCNHNYRVLRRVERIIDDKTGQMLRMKTPCIILDGVYTSGEFEHFCPQHDYIFWREAWLEPEERQPSEAQGAGL